MSGVRAHDDGTHARMRRARAVGEQGHFHQGPRALIAARLST